MPLGIKKIPGFLSSCTGQSSFMLHVMCVRNAVGDKVLYLFCSSESEQKIASKVPLAIIANLVFPNVFLCMTKVHF